MYIKYTNAFNMFNYVLFVLNVLTMLITHLYNIHIYLNSLNLSHPLQVGIFYI